ncbi:hypothetical protein QJU64_10875, partial [Pasteurella atlantica]|uniref:hypothetical protein n=1 Tax=Pasteurella atlantica TaxID=2827233 RepID=UPI0027484B14
MSSGEVSAFSGDNTVVGIFTFGNHPNDKSIILSGPNWTKRTTLGTFNPDNSGSSTLLYLNDDGTVAAGNAKNDNERDPRGRGIIWSGPNWATKTELGSLRADNTGISSVAGLSSDGTIAAGDTKKDGENKFRAIVWSGPNWATKTDLGTLKRDNRGYSGVNGLSRDGTIIVGSAFNDNNQTRGIVWSGPNWGTKTDLGTLKTDNSGESWVSTLSGDGMVVGGAAQNDNNEQRATLWSGPNWTTKTDLGTLKADNSGGAWVWALNDDGTIAGGRAPNDNNEKRATLWSGPNWTTKTDLGTLKADNSGNSSVTALSRDGRFAGGTAEDENGVSRATVWKVKNINNLTKIDIEHTKLSMVYLGNDALGVTSLQTHILQRLQQSRYFKKGKIGYSIRQDVAGQKGNKTASVGLGLSYGFGKGITAGINFDKSLSRQLPESYKTDGNTGLGLFANWKNNHWFIET